MNRDFPNSAIQTINTLKMFAHGSFLVAQRVKDLVLSLLWCRFDPQPKNFHMLQVKPKKKKILAQINHKKHKFKVKANLRFYAYQIIRKRDVDSTAGKAVLKLYMIVVLKIDASLWENSRAS